MIVSGFGFYPWDGSQVGPVTILLIKYKDIMNFAGKWMELENIILSEITQKDTYGMYSLKNWNYP